MTTSFKNLLAKLVVDLKLFWQAPKNYLFLYTYPTDKFISIKPFDPLVTQAGQEIVNRIKTKLPSLEVHFIGSAALQIAGEKDVDIYVAAPPRQFSRYLPELIRMFGPPIKKRQNFIEWKFDHKDCRIELLLISPESKNFQRQIKLFQLIKQNPDLTKEYEAIKLELNGTSVRNYHYKRMIFFHRVLGL